jgi:hypothetical protein
LVILDELNDFFETRVEVKRIRRGEHQTLETLINEETLLFAKYLRLESKNWTPRVACFPNPPPDVCATKTIKKGDFMTKERVRLSHIARAYNNVKN